mmetsp:Transcript_9751/g.23030  ORF Transcript_9751/g.23030 Transcript_9751/m.23030 type:complete len:237 (-) Transcript_9751:691-1401(-)
MLELEDVALVVDGLAIVPRLGECRLLPELLVLGMVDGSQQRRAAVLRAGDEVDRHDRLHPLPPGELQHVVPAGVAARSGLDVLLGRHGLQVRRRVGGGDDEQLIDEGLDVPHARLEVVDGVLRLELVVRLVVVDAGDDEVAELAEGHEDVLVAAVEQVEAADGVHLALLPSLGEAGLEGVGLVDEAGDGILELGQHLAVEEGVRLVQLGQPLLPDERTGALVVLLEDLAEGRLVEG